MRDSSGPVLTALACALLSTGVLLFHKEQSKLSGLRMFLVGALCWASALPALFWLSAPLLDSYPVVTFPAGGAVAAFVAGATLAAAVLLLVMLVPSGFAFVALGYSLRHLGVPARALARYGTIVVALSTLGLLGWLALSHDRLPADAYPSSLPVKQVLTGSRCFGWKPGPGFQVEQQPCDYDVNWCRLGDLRQPDESPCRGIEVRPDLARRGAWVSALTEQGSEFIAFCRSTAEQPFECPASVDVLSLGGFGVPPPFRWGAALGAVLALAATTRKSFGSKRSSTLPIALLLFALMASMPFYVAVSSGLR